MDPDEALRILRGEVATLSVAIGEGDPLWPIVEHFAALDRWLTSGGFPPEAWSTHEQRFRQRVMQALDGSYPEPLGPPDPAHGELPEHADG